MLNWYKSENTDAEGSAGGFVPDVYQCFTKEMGVFANPTSKVYSVYLIYWYKSTNSDT